MKKPREILLERHAPANARLDAVREQVLRGVTGPQRHDLGGDKAQDSIWRQIISWIAARPQTSAALAAAWMLIVFMRLTTHDGAPPGFQNTPLPQNVIAGLKEQRVLFAELAGMPAHIAAIAPKSSLPKPRSEQRRKTIVV